MRNAKALRTSIGAVRASRHAAVNGALRAAHARALESLARPAKVEEDFGAFHLAGMAASVALVGLAALFWLNTASAAPIKETGAELKSRCEDKVSSLYLAGSFVMPGKAQKMKLWVGKTTTSNQPIGLVAKTSATECEAICKVIRFERFKADQKPALMELDCEGQSLSTMRMPLHVQWIRDAKGTDALIRLGSALYGVEQAPLEVEVNRYAVAEVAALK